MDQVLDDRGIGRAEIAWRRQTARGPDAGGAGGVEQSGTARPR